MNYIQISTVTPLASRLLSSIDEVRGALSEFYYLKGTCDILTQGGTDFTKMEETLGLKPGDGQVVYAIISDIVNANIVPAVSDTDPIGQNVPAFVLLTTMIGQ